MASYTILTFAAARELVGERLTLDLPPELCTRDLRREILSAYPALSELKNFAIAVNEAYAFPDEPVRPGDEIVIIPPVAGG